MDQFNEVERMAEMVSKSERVVRALKELGFLGNEEIGGVVECKVDEFVESNVNQVNTDRDEEMKEAEYDTINQEILDRILKEGKVALAEIVDRAYEEAYYGKI